MRFARQVAWPGWLHGRSMTAPTSQTTRFIIIYGRGRGIPRPYGVVNFVVAIFRDDVIFPAGL